MRSFDLTCQPTAHVPVEAEVQRDVAIVDNNKPDFQSIIFSFFLIDVTVDPTIWLSLVSWAIE